MNPIKKAMLAVAALAACLAVSAQSYRLEGKVGDQYPIVIELQEEGNGLFSGRYAYQSTLRKQGDVPCSWLSIRPSSDEPYWKWIVRDCKKQVVETWYGPNFADRQFLTARLQNAKGRTYDVTAAVAGQKNAKQPLTGYFRQHLGGTPSEFGLFKESRVDTRLSQLMGIMNYLEFQDIYQVQGPMEYHDGMFWGWGFKAHQCCDPAAVWAYDTYANAFYVWVRMNERDYWWSEAGEVPLKFVGVVQDQFGGL